MPAEWIKIENHLHEKLEIATIAEHTGLDVDAVVGKLVRVWAWSSRNCYGDGVTDVTALRVIREITRCEAFDEALIKTGWIVVKGDKITFSNFDRHNSQTAKERALASARMAKKRGSEKVTEMLRPQRNKNVTRREENITVAKAPVQFVSCV